MRGGDERTGALFGYVSCETRVPPDHPLRLILGMVDEALDVLSPEFDRLYAQVGRPGIAPEKLLRALLLQAFYSVRSERQLMEQLDYNLLFRWSVGFSMDAPVWEASTVSKNRDRLLDADVAQRLLAAVVAQPRIKAPTSNEHCYADGTLIQAWASHKSFQPKPGSDDDGPGGPPADHGPAGLGRNAQRNWCGQRRSNETHASITDPDARFARKSSGRASMGGRAHDAPCRLCRVRMWIEEVFGWIKGSAGLRQTKHRGRNRVGWQFDLAITAYNPIRLPSLLAAAPA